MASIVFQTAFSAVPFDALAPAYDETFTNSRIGRAQREVVTRELDRVFRPGQCILECNCGTGVDAIHLASRGVEVLACDISSRMIEHARRSADQANRESRLRAPVTFRALPTEEIGRLRQEGLAGCFDGAFSNFAGMNCVADLRSVARDLAVLLEPGAPFVLCVFGLFCAWEVLWYLVHGKPLKAVRRLRQTESVVRFAESAMVRVHYPSIGKLLRDFSPEFKLKCWRGVGLAVPPTYLEALARRFPKLFEIFARLDQKIGSLPLIRGMADHVLLTFERQKLVGRGS